jgi:4-amino-4-deoxy-L-arabinose transferase-like glycosyltransferase
VAIVAVGATLLLLAFATRDGYHRDELYFLEASRHVAFGYVDQPPLGVMMPWLSRALFGDSLFGEERCSSPG